MFQRVHVGHDGSPGAEDALALARRLCDPVTGTLTTVHVAPTHRLALGRRDAGGGRVPPGTVEVAAASSARGLTEHAEEDGADLLVIGAHHSAEPGRVATRRTAIRLLHGAPCAIAVAPAGRRDADPFRHVGVAFDASAEARIALEAAYAVAAHHGAAVTLVRASGYAASSTDPELLSAEVEATLRAERLQVQHELDDAADAAPPGVNPRTMFVPGDAVPAITAAVDGVVDLLVCGSRAYGPLQRALAGSVSAGLLEGARQPVIVMPRPRAGARGGG